MELEKTFDFSDKIVINTLNNDKYMGNLLLEYSTPKRAFLRIQNKEAPDFEFDVPITSHRDHCFILNGRCNNVRRFPIFLRMAAD